MKDPSFLLTRIFFTVIQEEEYYQASNITEGITENQYVVNLIIENADDDVDVTIHVENDYGEFRHNIMVSSIFFLTWYSSQIY